MYCNFFQLRCAPFEDRVDTQFFFATPDAEETLASMEYTAHYGDNVSLVIGEAGTGKTMAVRSLLGRLKSTDHVVVLTMPPTANMRLIRDVAKGFGVSLPSSSDSKRSLSRLKRALLKQRKGDHRSILIIDQAENLSRKNLLEVASLNELEHGVGKLLQIMLIGQPRLVSSLERREFDRLRQQAFGSRSLKPLAETETEGYIQYRLEQAGAPKNDIFDESAIKLIHAESGGNCRIINHICEAALVAAFGAEQAQITSQIVEDVIGERIVARQTPHQEVSQSASDVAGQVDSSGWPTSQASTAESGSEECSSDLKTEEESQGWSPDEYEAQNTEPDYRFSGLPASVGEPTGQAVGGGTALLRRQELVSKAIETLVNDGESVLGQLERTTRKADRSRAAQEAGLAQYSSIEEHLTSLTGGAGKLIKMLASNVERAQESTEAAQRRSDAIAQTMEEKLKDFESRTAKLETTSDGMTEQVERVEQACKRADKVESLLRGFADQLTGKMERAQERVSLLMTSLDAGEDAHAKLEALFKDVSTMMSGADEKIESQRDNLRRFHEEATTCERSVSKAMDDARKAVVDVENVERRTGELRPVLERFNQTIAESESARAETSKTVDRAKETQAGLSKMNHQSEAVLGEIQAVQAKLEMLQRNASADLVDIGGAYERVGTMREDVARCEQFLQRMTATQIGDEDGSRSLAKILAEMHDQYDSIKSLVAGADERIAKLDKRHSSADVVVRQLDQANNAGLEMLRRTEESSRAIEQQIDIGTESVSAMARTLEAAESRACEVVTQADSRSSEFADNADKAHTKLAAAIERTESLLADVHNNRGQLEVLNHGTADRLVELRGACERLDSLWERAAECEQILARLESTGAGGDQLAKELQETVDDAHRTNATIKMILVQTEDRISQLDSHHAAAGSLLRRLAETNVEGHKIVQQTGESAKTAGKRLMALTRENQSAGEIAHRIAESIGEADAKVSEIHEALTRGEGLIRGVDDTRNRCEHQHQLLGGRIEAAVSTTSDLADVHEEAGRTLKEFSERMSNATETIAELTSGNEHAMETATALSSVRDDAEGTIDQAQRKMIDLEQVSRSVEGTLQDAKSLSATSEARALELTQSHQSAQATVVRLKELNEQISDAAVRLAELTACSEHAAETTATLSSMREDAEGTIDQAQRKVGDLERASRSVEGILQDAKSLSATSEARALELTQSHQSAQEVLGRINEAAANAQSVSQQAVDAQQRLTDEARGTTERLATAREEAKTVLKSLDEINEQGKTAYKQLNDKTGEISVTLKRADDVNRSLSEQADSIEGGERMLDELLDRARKLADHLRKLDDKAGQMDKIVAQAAVKPTRIIAQAQEQAEKLETVCNAVRKVFAGLSKATLESNQSKQAIEQAERKAVQRLTVLKTQTQQTSGTLSRWVEEASQTQARLAETLGRCPSIAETHPIDLSNLYVSTDDEQERFMEETETGKILAEPVSVPAHAVEKRNIPSNRAEEISQIIEDVKHSRKEERETVSP